MAKLKDVPAAKVGDKIQSFVDEGKKKIEAKRQSDGRWTIVATA
jgi:hypothetical protein